MKKLIIVALAATSIPTLTTTTSAAAGDSGASERRYCAQASIARAGSRMPARRFCRTAGEWQAALGPDWRQRLTGRSVQDDLDGLAARGVAVDDTALGQQGVPIGHPGRRAMRGGD
jgi:hypothetical protein